MTRQLITTWAEYQAGMDQLLAMAEREVRLYDQDLELQKLDSGPRFGCLERLLHGKQAVDTLCLMLRDAEAFQTRHPRLMTLLTHHTHTMSVRQTPEAYAHLRDSMLLIDGRHALIRFDREQPRSKLLIDEVEEISPYLDRFEELWNEGAVISPTTLGL